MNSAMIDSRELKELGEEFGISLIYIHGSSVSDSQTPLSDTDLAILFEEKKSEETIIDLSNIVERLEKILSNREIDLKILNKAPIVFRYRVQRYGKCLYAASQHFRHLEEERVRLRYFDFEPVHKRFLDLTMKRLREKT